VPTRSVLLIVAIAVRATSASAQSPSEDRPPARLPASNDDVSSRLDDAAVDRAGLVDWGPVSTVGRGWDRLNGRMEETTGVRLGVAYTLTFQAASSGPGDRSGTEGDLDLFAAWRIIGEEGGEDQGAFSLNAQHIHRIGQVAPANLSSEIGAIWETSDGIGADESFPIVQFYYEQHLLSDRLMLVLGKIDTTNYVGTNRFADDTLYFMNRSFSSNPAINYPGNGLGGVIGWQVTDRIIVGGCIADANGVETEAGFHTIEAGEYFMAAEVGLTLDFEGAGEGNYRLTAWRSDEAEDAELPEDFGFSFSADQEIGGPAVPFVRASWADGDATGVSAVVGGGLGFEGLMGREEDAAGVGVSWGSSTVEGVNDQVVSEVFYRVQLARSVQCTLGAQVIFNAPDLESERDGEETVGVFEARLRITF
jgi:porin